MKTTETLALQPDDRVYITPSLPLGGQNGTVMAVRLKGGNLLVAQKLEGSAILSKDVPAGYVLVHPDSAQFSYWMAPVELLPERDLSKRGIYREEA